MNTKLFAIMCLTSALVLVVFAGLLTLLEVGASSASDNTLDKPAETRLQPTYYNESIIQVSTLPYTTVVEVSPFIDPTTLDPALAYDSASMHVIQQIYEPLVTYNREKADELIPQLATSWEISSNGRTYSFTIRKGVEFQEGGTLQPHDVAYTLQRGLLQSDPSSAQWLLIEPIMGYVSGDITEEIAGGAYAGDPEGLRANADPAELLAICQKVKAAIVADDAAGTVTFNLSQPGEQFLITLAQSWGSILDSEWAIEQGAWNGDCSTWQNYYSPGAANSELTPIANGTGPYILDYWTPDVEVVLERNPYYWRHTPMWLGGPSGPAAIEHVMIKEIGDSATRYQMLIDGDADLGYFFGYDSQLADHVMLHYDQPDGRISKLEHLTGTLQAYSGVLSPSATDAFFTYDIDTNGPRNYVGSGTFDGNGIPTDFFSDIHVRKGFNYAFDWSQYITNAYGGEAIQRRGPIIKGIMGYTDTQPTYFYSPTLAMQELNQAWGGQVVSSGFAFTITYNSGNVTRQAAAETIKAGIEALSPDFQVNVMGLPWSDYLSDMRNGQIPIFIAGWIQDIPHPYNWVKPYLLGGYASRQRLPADQQAVYQAKVATCLALSGEAARTCYEDIQVTTYANATDIFLAQVTETDFVRAEIRGYYANLAFSNHPYFYALSKGFLPVAETVTPGIDKAIDFESTTGTTGTVFLPSGSVTQTTDIVVIPDTIPGDAPPGYKLSKLAFEIQAYSSDGTLNTSLTFDNPIILTLYYNARTVAPLVEDSLQLFWWNGSSWEDAACGAYIRDTVNDILQVPICHLSKFALVPFQPGYD